VLCGVWRGAPSVRRFLKRHAIDGGPQASVIVGDREVLLAAAGLRRPQVVVSAGALMSLDDDELAAGLAHERGHIAHRHRWVLALGCALAAIGRFVPGTRHALAELELHLERDADAFALRQHDKLALASAICKTAAGQTALPRPAMGLAGGRFRRRMALLLEQDPLSRAERGPRALAAIMLAVVVAATASVPASAAQGLDAPSGPSLEHCMT
jgi:beta-lactamase regulating signal transducer with metallopeptidase domain